MDEKRNHLLAQLKNAQKRGLYWRLADIVKDLERLERNMPSQKKKKDGKT